MPGAPTWIATIQIVSGSSLDDRRGILASLPSEPEIILVRIHQSNKCQSYGLPQFVLLSWVPVKEMPPGKLVPKFIAAL